MKFIHLESIKKITAFALPISASSLINMIASFVAMRFVAQLGQLELAASALAITTFVTIMTVVGTSLYAVSILISHYRAQQKSAKEIGQLVKNGFWLAIILAIPASIVLINIEKILILFGESPQLVAITQNFFYFSAMSMFPTLILSVIYQFYTGLGKPKIIFLATMICFPLIVLWSYGFVLGKFGLPQLGLAGVALAGFVVQLLFCICMLVYMYFKKELRPYEIFHGEFRPNWVLCKTIFMLGFPIGIQFGGELAAMTVAIYFMGYFGVVALAASQIVSQYSMLVVMIFLGLSQALSILVSEAFGTLDIELIKRDISSAMIVLGILCIVIFAVFILIPEPLINFFIITSDRNLIHLSKLLFYVAAIMLLIDGIRNLLSGALRGLHDSRAPMRIGIICLWIISLPISYLVGFTFHAGPVGLRIGFMSGFIVAVVLLWERILSKLKSLVVK